MSSLTRNTNFGSQSSAFCSFKKLGLENAGTSHQLRQCASNNNDVIVTTNPQTGISTSTLRTVPLSDSTSQDLVHLDLSSKSSGSSSSRRTQNVIQASTVRLLDTYQKCGLKRKSEELDNRQYSSTRHDRQDRYLKERTERNDKHEKSHTSSHTSKATTSNANTTSNSNKNANSSKKSSSSGEGGLSVSPA